MRYFLRHPLAWVLCRIFGIHQHSDKRMALDASSNLLIGAETDCCERLVRVGWVDSSGQDRDNVDSLYRVGWVLVGMSHLQ